MFPGIAEISRKLDLKRQKLTIFVNSTARSRAKALEASVRLTNHGVRNVDRPSRKLHMAQILHYYHQRGSLQCSRIRSTKSI